MGSFKADKEYSWVKEPSKDWAIIQWLRKDEAWL